jgi:hypothetical protein
VIFQTYKNVVKKSVHSFGWLLWLCFYPFRCFYWKVIGSSLQKWTFNYQFWSTLMSFHPLKQIFKVVSYVYQFYVFSIISVVLNFSFWVGFLFKFDIVYYFLLMANRKMDG